MKVDKDYTEKVVKEDLSRKYLDITEFEFLNVSQRLRW